MGIIGSIRKHSWVAVAIVGIAIVAFIIGDLTKNNGGVPDMGKVNSTILTSQRFEALVSNMENNYKMQANTTQVPAEVENQLRDQVWNNFVENTLMDEEYTKLGLTVTDAELNDMYIGTFIHPYLRQIPAFNDQESGQYDKNRVAQFLANFDQLEANSRTALTEVEDYVKSDRLTTKYNSLIEAGMYMPHAIAQMVANYGKESKDVLVAALPFQTMADDEVELSDSDYKTYYDKHKVEFRVREELHELNYIVFPINPTVEDLVQIETDVNKTWEEFQEADNNEIAIFVNSESDVPYDSTYMQANRFPNPIDEIVASASVGTMIAPLSTGSEWIMGKVLDVAMRPDSVRASIVFIANNRAGESITRTDDQAHHLADSVLNLLRANRVSLEQAIEQFADDKQNVDMGWQEDGKIYSELNNLINSTPVDGVFQMRDPRGVGYMVVKVTGKSPLQKKYRVALIHRHIVPSNTTNRNIYNEANLFAGQNRTVAEMQSAAQQQNLQIRNTMVSAAASQLPGLSNARQLVQWSYNNKVKKGDVADQVYECGDAFVVVALKEIYKPEYPTYDQLKDIMEQQVRLTKKSDMLLVKAQEALTVGKNLQSYAIALGIDIDTITGVSLNDYYMGRFGMEPKVQAAIAVGAGMIGPIKGANGIYLVQIDNTSTSTDVDVEAIQNQMQQSLRSKTRLSRQSFSDLQQALRDNAKIVDQRVKFF
ncbi:MAG: SurA N-terminal domain-containing protein [Bacteroidales bacterium]|nr:SurA N-terminal domain-containing protein [Bacteroidales bacterium]